MSFAEQSAEMEKAKVKAGCLIRKQAEISFKAGIKEVVGWIEKENPFSFIYRSSVKYQTKLKDWGIE